MDTWNLLDQRRCGGGSTEIRPSYEKQPMVVDKMSEIINIGGTRRGRRKLKIL